ncbi:MAG: tRNA pseudouridine(38-40) synthase TruA [Methanobacteriota archaeon]
MPRYAMKIAYDGSAFSGSQRQPDARTVEGELARAAREIGAIGDEEWIPIGSRTDAGVSATGNVCAIDTGFDREALVPAINSQTDDVWICGLADVSEGFNPRHAKARWYRYLLPAEDLDIELAGEVLPAFVGERDFTHFSKYDDTADRSPLRTLHLVTLKPAGDFLALDVMGESFLWQMVRRIAGAVRMVGTGSATAAEVREALSAPGAYKRPVFTPLPPEGLVLMDAEYGIEFALEPLPERFHRACLQAKLKSGFYAELEKRLSGV